MKNIYNSNTLFWLQVWPLVCFLAGRGGRVAAHGGTLSSFIVKNIALDKTDDSNPRQAILRHAKEAAENPYWVAPAYKA